MKAKTKTIAILLALLMIFSIACNSSNEETVRRFATLFNETQDIGEGTTVFLFEATDGEDNTVSWNVHTNAATVGDALFDLGMIDGSFSDFGLMVSHVHGLRADFDEDSAWWAFYIDGEMAMVGVDSADIEEGVTYAFVYTPA